MRALLYVARRRIVPVARRPLRVPLIVVFSDPAGLLKAALKRRPFTAIVANVDPVQYGLVKRDGSLYVLAADPVPLEAFVNYLSDHDYVVSIHAMLINAG